MSNDIAIAEDGGKLILTGHLQLLESSSVDPAIWLTALAYPQPPCPPDFPDGSPETNVGLHVRAWQARCVAYQLLDHVDPGGSTNPEPGDG